MKHTDDMIFYKEKPQESTKTPLTYEWLQQYDKLWNHYVNVIYISYILVEVSLKTLLRKYSSLSSTELQELAQP